MEKRIMMFVTINGLDVERFIVTFSNETGLVDGIICSEIIARGRGKRDALNEFVMNFEPGISFWATTEQITRLRRASRLHEPMKYVFTELYAGRNP